MKLSYWEKKSWFTNVDYCIVGSGIVGLSCALELKKMHPKSKILVLEKGILPQGASTKNAGFACFGSMSEILSDLNNHSEKEVFDLVKQRFQGLQLLRENLGDKNIDYQQNGGFELFLTQDKPLFEACYSKSDTINELLNPIFKSHVFNIQKDTFNFQNILEHQIFNKFEGQIDTGKMMQSLLQKVQSKGVMLLNATEVQEYISHDHNVTIKLKDFEFSARHLLIATNAFSKKLLNLNLKPARNQVIITEPIQNLHIKGTFHLHEGYYYFRNIDNRILLGGGRHLDPKGETTTTFGLTEDIQIALERILYEIILPQAKENKIDIEQRWSGILGVGNQKKAIVKSVDKRVHCGVRLGGMGIAIGSEIGRKLAVLTK